jgi:hypothetical protein
MGAFGFDFRLDLKASVALGAVGSSVPVNTLAGEVSGTTPRQGLTAWLGAGEYDEDGPVPNLFRYTLNVDGVEEFATETDEVAISFIWEAGHVGKPYALTVEASADAGATWNDPVDVVPSFAWPSSLVMPATIAAPAVARDSASGDTPVELTITHASLYPAYLWQFRNLEADGETEAYRGTKGVSDAEIVATSFTPNWSGDTDPVPSAPWPALDADQKFQCRLVSPDYQEMPEGFEPVGIASDWSDVMNVTDVVEMVMDATTAGANITLTDGGLTVAKTGGGTSGVYSNRSLSSGKIYFEVIITARASAFTCIGLISAGRSVTSDWRSTGQTNLLAWDNGGTVYGAFPFSRGGWAAGDRLRIAVDIDTGLFYMGKNSAWTEEPDVDDGIELDTVGVPIFIGFNGGTGSGDEVTFVFKSEDWLDPAPLTYGEA